jgi:hypothetical protein
MHERGGSTMHEITRITIELEQPIKTTDVEQFRRWLTGYIKPLSPMPEIYFVTREGGENGQA